MEWVPAISTTTLLAIVAWLGRNLIATRLTSAVKHEYDEKIESLKASLRKNEEAFRADLKAKETQIDALRSGALSGIVNRQAVLYERQLNAVEKLWEAVIFLSSAKYISQFMASVKFDVSAQEAARNEQFREFFKKIGGNLDINSFKTEDASKVRPFISPLTWAYYSAYQSIIIHSVVKLHFLQNGIDSKYLDTTAITKLIKVTLPHQEEYIEKYGTSAFHFLLEEIETKLLLEIDNMLRGEKSDRESIEKAAMILKEAERLMETNVTESQNEQFNK